jgi:preprotein translocase subunit Sss1
MVEFLEMFLIRVKNYWTEYSKIIRVLKKPCKVKLIN